jgi:carbon monoxide dehydrogenase subunit G
MTPQAQSKQNARIGRDAQAKIGQQLRAMYAELIKQELPESLRELVRRLALPQQPP